MLKVILKSENSALTIEIADTGWARCYLETDSPIFLGAETIAYIIPRLLTGLETDIVNDPRYIAEIEGYKAMYLLVLMEAHHSLFVSDLGDQRLFLWENVQSEPVTFVDTMSLSPHMQQEWKDQLLTLRESLVDTAAWVKVPPMK